MKMEEKSNEISRQLNSGYCVKMVHPRREEHKIKIKLWRTGFYIFVILLTMVLGRTVWSYDVAHWTLRGSQLKYILQQDN